MLHRMTHDGLAYSFSDSNDGRAKKVCLTEKGNPDCMGNTLCVDNKVLFISRGNLAVDEPELQVSELSLSLATEIPKAILDIIDNSFVFSIDELNLAKRKKKLCIFFQIVKAII